MNKYAKELLAVLVAAVGALVTALGTGGGTFSSVDGKHWVIAIIAVLGSGAVTAIPDNVPGVAGGIMKAAIAFLTAGFGSVVIALNDNHISQAEWATAASAAVVALAAVYQVTSSSPKSSVTV